jgi:hypothetical protein
MSHSNLAARSISVADTTKLRNVSRDAAWIETAKAAAGCTNSTKVRLPTSKAASHSTATKLSAVKTSTVKSTTATSEATASDTSVAAAELTVPKWIEDHRMTSRPELRISVSTLKRLISTLHSLHLQALKALPQRLILLSEFLLRSDESEVVLPDTGIATSQQIQVRAIRWRASWLAPTKLCCGWRRPGQDGSYQDRKLK